MFAHDRTAPTRTRSYISRGAPYQRRNRLIMPDRDSVAIHQQLGQVLEAQRRAGEDRLDTTHKLEKVQDTVEGVSRQLVALTQTTASIGSAVTALSVEKCGERLDKLEEAVFDGKLAATIAANQAKIARLESVNANWRRWLGSGWTFFGRLVLALVASGVFWAGVQKLGKWLGGLN